jgi:hypothetical protein
MRVSTTIVFALCLAPSLGCPGNTTTEFPPGLAPLGENRAPPIDGTDDDPHPERSSLVSGGGDHDWAHARGFIKRPLLDVWAALCDPQVVYERRQTDRQEYMPQEDPAYDHLYIISYGIDGLITIEWDEEWRYGMVEGGTEPSLALVRYQKIWGSEYLDLVEGSILVRAVTSDVSEIEIIKNMKAFSKDEGDVKLMVSDMFEDVLAASHGLPTPH